MPRSNKPACRTAERSRSDRRNPPSHSRSAQSTEVPEVPGCCRGRSGPKPRAEQVCVQDAPCPTLLHAGPLDKFLTRSLFTAHPYLGAGDYCICQTPSSLVSMSAMLYSFMKLVIWLIFRVAELYAKYSQELEVIQVVRVGPHMFGELVHIRLTDDRLPVRLVRAFRRPPRKPFAKRAAA
jgi:hypothetical protein